MLKAWRFHRPPRRRWRVTALKLVSAAVGLFLVLHAMSCGLFFCFRLPGFTTLSPHIYDDLREISVFPGTPFLLSSTQSACPQQQIA